MSPTTLQVPGRSFGEWLGEIFANRLTGRLDLIEMGEVASLYFIAGELYLAPEHPAYGVAESWLGSSVGENAPEVSVEVDDPKVAAFRGLAGEILTLAATEGSGECSFSEGAAQIRIDLIGPLPTGQLLMESSAKDQDEQELLKQLGGEEIKLQVAGDGEAPPGITLDPHEAFVLTRLEQPLAVSELFQQMDLDRGKVLEKLCRLQAIGLIRTADEQKDSEVAKDPADLIVERFQAKISESLVSDPMEVETDQHRELLGNLMGRLGELTFFELLTVTPQSTDEEIHKAYFELGRLVHPDHADRLGLAGKEGAMEVLFERATEAYLTLSDPDKRVHYSRELGPMSQATISGPPSLERVEESKTLARQNYDLAYGLAERSEFHAAIQLLEQVVKSDPQAEYFTLLADCQAENPQWLDRAVFNYKRAANLQPDDPSLKTKLGRIHERRGETQSAKAAYEAALVVAPEFEMAKAGLARLGVKLYQPKGTFSRRLKAMLGISPRD